MLRPAAAGVDVSVIVVTFNNQEIIGRCLAAVEASATNHTAEVIVVDNASVDDTVQCAREAAREATIIALEENSGFAAANNAALAQARGRYVVLVNSDAFPDRGAIDQLICRADGNPRIGLVGGMLRYPSGRLQPSMGSFPSLLGNLGVALFWHRMPLVRRLPLSVAAGPSHYREAHRVDWVGGAFCLARRDIGSMPTGGFMYGEDVEWSRQAHERGFEAWLEPRARAVHLGGGGVESVAAATFRQTSRVDFELRWFRARGSWAVVADRIVMAIHALVRLGLSAAVLPVRPALGRVRIAEFRALLRAAVHRSARPV
jgi:GT2 family glycosyltransferase